MAGRRGQYISTSELDEKIFALIKATGKSESGIVREVLERHFKECEHLWGTQITGNIATGNSESICVKCGERPRPYAIPYLEDTITLDQMPKQYNHDPSSKAK